MTKQQAEHNNDTAEEAVSDVQEDNENQQEQEQEQVIETIPVTDTEAGAVEAVTLQRDEFKAALQRERADFVNYKKRTERERAEMRSSIIGDTVGKFLPILDDFERALSVVPESADDDGWVKGFSMIRKKFNDLLTQMGIEVIDPLGEPFDPNLHEAIGSEDSDTYDSDTVMMVLQKGYVMDDRVIRVAMVKVAN